MQAGQIALVNEVCYNLFTETNHPKENIMITHGTKTSKVFSTGKNPKVEVIRGYYLVTHAGDRYWLGGDKYTAAKALNKIVHHPPEST